MPVVGDFWEPHGVSCELETGPDGDRVPTATVFLDGAHCPFPCRFCDLARYTYPGETPRGALVAQVAHSLRLLESLSEEQIGVSADQIRQIKLYNASNFFDRRTVPVEDLPELAEQMARFERVVVESHPRLLSGLDDFAARLPGSLEVAMGLETIHPESFRWLQKGVELDTFLETARRVAASHSLRLFVLMGLPGLPVEESVEWVARSVRAAIDCGARLVSVIPLRGGARELATLEQEGEWHPPRLEWVEESLIRSAAEAVGSTTQVQLDPWDLDQLEGCASCRSDREARLARLHLLPSPSLSPADLRSLSCPARCTKSADEPC